MTYIIHNILLLILIPTLLINITPIMPIIPMLINLIILIIIILVILVIVVRFIFFNFLISKYTINTKITYSNYSLNKINTLNTSLYIMLSRSKVIEELIKVDHGIFYITILQNEGHLLIKEELRYERLSITLKYLYEKKIFHADMNLKDLKTDEIFKNAESLSDSYEMLSQVICKPGGLDFEVNINCIYMVLRMEFLSKIKQCRVRLYKEDIADANLIGGLAGNSTTAMNLLGSTPTHINHHNMHSIQQRNTTSSPNELFNPNFNLNNLNNYSGANLNIQSFPNTATTRRQFSLKENNEIVENEEENLVVDDDPKDKAYRTRGSSNLNNTGSSGNTNTNSIANPNTNARSRGGYKTLDKKAAISSYNQNTRNINHVLNNKNTNNNNTTNITNTGILRNRSRDLEVETYVPYNTVNTVNTVNTTNTTSMNNLHPNRFSGVQDSIKIMKTKQAIKLIQQKQNQKQLLKENKDTKDTSVKKNPENINLNLNKNQDSSSNRKQREVYVCVKDKEEILKKEQCKISTLSNSRKSRDNSRKNITYNSITNNNTNTTTNVNNLKDISTMIYNNYKRGNNTLENTSYINNTNILQNTNIEQEPENQNQQELENECNFSISILTPSNISTIDFISEWSESLDPSDFNSQNSEKIYYNQPSLEQLRMTQDSEDLYREGLAYELGTSQRKKSLKKAIRYYKVAAEKEHDLALFKLGYFYFTGKDDNLTIDKQKAYKIFKISVQKYKNSFSMFYLGKYYCDYIDSRNHSIESNSNLQRKAFYYYKNSALGQDNLEEDLIDLVEINREENSSNPEILEKKSLRNPEAYVALGLCYVHGIGLGINGVDFEKGYAYFKKAVKFGSSNGHLNCGFACLNGHGREKDKKQASLHFKLAADNIEDPNAEAMYRYAVMLTLGDGIQKSIKIAKVYNNMAMKMNHELALAKEGNIY